MRATSRQGREREKGRKGGESKGRKGTEGAGGNAHEINFWSQPCP